MTMATKSQTNLIQSTTRTAAATDKPTIPIRVATPFKRTYFSASGSMDHQIEPIQFHTTYAIHMAINRPVVGFLHQHPLKGQPSAYPIQYWYPHQLPLCLTAIAKKIMLCSERMRQQQLATNTCNCTRKPVNKKATHSAHHLHFETLN